MYTFHYKGFTLIEMMVVIMILGILFTGLYMGAQPYFMRSRDTKRATDIQGYLTIIEGYEKNYDTFPSNYGSGGNALIQGYCLSEIGKRSSIGLTPDMQFTGLNAETSAPPVDPGNLDSILPCTEKGSFFYSRIKYDGGTSEIAIIGANFEIRASGNYGTGSDLVLLSKVPDIINAKSSTIPASAPNQIFIGSRLR